MKAGDPIVNMDALFGYPAWTGFLDWAIRNEEVAAAFTKDTGFAFPKNALEVAIDKAAGVNVWLEFTLYATQNWWGIEAAPPSIQAIAADRAAQESPVKWSKPQVAMEFTAICHDINVLIDRFKRARGHSDAELRARIEATPDFQPLLDLKASPFRIFGDELLAEFEAEKAPPKPPGAQV